MPPRVETGAPDGHETVIQITGLKTQFGKQVVHENLDLEVRRGEVLGVVGGSGTGKSVLPARDCRPAEGGRRNDQRIGHQCDP